MKRVQITSIVMAALICTVGCVEQNEPTSGTCGGQFLPNGTVVESSEVMSLGSVTVDQRRIEVVRDQELLEGLVDPQSLRQIDFSAEEVVLYSIVQDSCGDRGCFNGVVDLDDGRRAVVLGEKDSTSMACDARMSDYQLRAVILPRSDRSVFLYALDTSGQAQEITDSLADGIEPEVIFEFSRIRGEGFCPSVNEIFQATIYRYAGGTYELSGSQLIEGDSASDDCLDNLSVAQDCLVEVSLDTQQLAGEQASEFESLLAAVPQSAPVLDGACDPCLITVYEFDDLSLQANPCAEPDEQYDQSLASLNEFLANFLPLGSAGGDGDSDVDDHTVTSRVHDFRAFSSFTYRAGLNDSNTLQGSVERVRVRWNESGKYTYQVSVANGEGGVVQFPSKVLSDDTTDVLLGVFGEIEVIKHWGDPPGYCAFVEESLLSETFEWDDELYVPVNECFLRKGITEEDYAEIKGMMATLVQDEGSLINTPASRCSAFENIVFESVGLLPGGETPGGGAIMTHWTVSFSGGEFVWNSYDSVSLGKYSCEGLNIFELKGSLQVPVGHYEPESGILVWNGFEYVEAGEF